LKKKKKVAKQNSEKNRTFDEQTIKLKDFIESQLENGRTQKELKNVLLLKNWPEKIINDIFEVINKELENKKEMLDINSENHSNNGFLHSIDSIGKDNILKIEKSLKETEPDKNTNINEPLKIEKGKDVVKVLRDKIKTEKSRFSFVLRKLMKIIAEENLTNYLEDSYCDAKQRISKVFNKNKKSNLELNKLMTGPDSVLLLSSITKSFGQTLILSDVNLEFKKQDIIGIIGLSGSGKTTLLNLITGFLVPDDGKILYKDLKKGQVYDVLESKAELTRLFGLAPQKPSFYHKLTVWENLDYFASLYNMRYAERKKRILSLLELVNLEHAHDTLGEKLSGGMQRRLGIACSLVHDPEILILDEPTADLDPILRKEIWALIQKINRQGKTILLTSHFLNEVEDLCTKIGVLNKHKICAYGTKKELEKGFSQEEVVKVLFKSKDYSKFIQKIQKEDLSVVQIDIKRDFLLIRTKNTQAVIKFIMNYLEKNSKEEMLDFELNKPSLNQLFESIIQPKKYWS
jgi:ABC-2 type transport system ATP-binding protein